MHRRWPVWPVLLLLAFPLAGADEAPQLGIRLVTPAVDFGTGEALGGPLMAMALHDTSEAPTVRLTGTTAGRVEVDERRSLTAGGPALAPTTGETRLLMEGDFHLRTIAPRDGALVQIFADGEARVSQTPASPSAAETSERGQLEQERPVNGSRVPRSASLLGSTAWHLAPGTSIEIQGSAYMVLWNVIVEVESASGSERVVTGTSTENPVPGYPGGAPDAGERVDRELHLFIESGTLEIQVPNSPVVGYVDFLEGNVSSLTALAQEAQVDAPGLATRDGSGQLVEARDVFVEHLAVRGGTIEVLASTAAPIQLGGETVALPALPSTTSTPTPEGGAVAEPDWDVPWWLGTIALVPILLLLYARPPYSWLRVALDLKAYEYVAGHSNHLLATKRGSRASVLKAVSLMSLARFDDAERFLVRLSPQGRPEAPTWHYLLANALSGQGRFSEAGIHLRECLLRAPQYREEVLENRVLAPAVPYAGLPPSGEREGYT